MIKLVRLDYRLVHGQVLAAWVNQISAQRIIVVDDAAANDEMRSAALKLAKLYVTPKSIGAAPVTVANAPKGYLEESPNTSTIISTNDTKRALNVLLFVICSYSSR